MNTKELRVGNIVLAKVKVVEVETISDYGINLYAHQYEISSEFDLTEIQGIPLTKEWLLKFGFEKYKHFTTCWRIGMFLVEDGIANVHNQGFSFRVILDDENSIHIRLVKYVHQFQNLYFVLTGEELTIKE